MRGCVVNGALLALVRFVLSRAGLRRVARRVLRSAPSLQARLQLWMHRSALPARPAGGNQMSARARTLLRQLERARRSV